MDKASEENRTKNYRGKQDSVRGKRINYQRKTGQSIKGKRKNYQGKTGLSFRGKQHQRDTGQSTRRRLVTAGQVSTMHYLKKEVLIGRVLKGRTVK